MKRFLIGAAASAIMFASSALPALAHEGHASCQTFGTVEAAFAQDLDGNGTPGLGEFASVLNPVNDEVALFHTLGCTPK